VIGPHPADLMRSAARMPAHDLLRALRDHGGLATVPVLVAATGNQPRTIRRHAARLGCWQPFPSVVGLPRPTPSRRDRIHAAVLHAAGTTGEASRDLVAVTRVSALHLLGLAAAAPTRVQLVVPRERAVRPHPRLDVTRSAFLRPADVTVSSRIPLLRGGALLRDLAAVRDLERLRADAIDLLHRRWCSLEDLIDLVERDRGFRGRRRLAQVATELAAVGRVDSVLEFEARRRFSAAGIHFDRGQVVVPPAGDGRWATPIHLDLGIAAIRFGIEVDSMAFHSSPGDLRRDAARANRVAAQLDDWRVLHLTWADLQETWAAFVALTRQVIGDQARRHLGRDWPTEGDLRGA
jgi:hypothetical protein